MAQMTDDTMDAESAENVKASSQGVSRNGRKTLEDQLAEIDSQRRKLLDRIRVRDKAAREQYEKELWELLKAEGFDQISIEVWRGAAAKIARVLSAQVE